MRVYMNVPLGRLNYTDLVEMRWIRNKNRVLPSYKYYVYLLGVF